MFAQLDFHKEDADCIIVLKNDFGVEREIVISRWHIGLLADEYSGIVLGAFVALERTPSADSTLEVLESALRPNQNRRNDHKYALVTDKNVFLSELMPEFEHQTFSALKMDNAWSNAAHEVVNNIMDTVGCAVNFGPVRAWWRRYVIERIFEALEARGLHRLPSTHGIGPQDTRKNDPAGAAIKFRIMLSDLIAEMYACIKLHNTKTNERLQWSAPLECVQSALQHSQSGFFPQPLPLATQQSLWLTMHIEETTVCGSLEKNVRPYFTTDRCRYTNTALANSYWLIGQTIILFIDRRKCSIVYATVKGTGQRLGLMTAMGKWANSNCSWRDRKLINRSGQNLRLGDEDEDPLETLKQQKAALLSQRKQSQRKRASKVGLDLARLVAQKDGVKPIYEQNPPSQPQQITETKPIEDTPVPEDKEPVRKTADPFGLLSVPSIAVIRRGR